MTERRTTVLNANWLRRDDQAIVFGAGGGVSKGLVLGVKNSTPGFVVVTLLEKGAVVRIHTPALARTMMVPS